MLLSYLVSASFAFAATSALTWEDCVRRAQNENAEILGGQNQVNAAESQVRASRSGFLPQISAGLSSSAATGGQDLLNPTGTTYSASLTGTQNIFAGFQDLGRVRQATGNLAIAEAGYQITRARISFELAEAFSASTYSREYMKLTKEIVRRREENLRLVELRFSVGRENKGSALLSQAYLEQARFDDLQAEGAYQTSRAQMAKALSYDDPSILDTTGEAPLKEPSANNPDFRRLALETPEYVQSSAQESTAEAAILTARSQFYPNINLVGTLATHSYDFFPHENQRWTVGVNLALPLFNGGKDYYGTQSASASRDAAERARESAYRQTVVRLEQTYHAYLESVAKLRADTSFKQASLVRAQIARTKYGSGLLSFEDWDVIENDLISRQKSYLQSRRDRVTAEAAWEQAQGKGVLNERR